MFLEIWPDIFCGFACRFADYQPLAMSVLSECPFSFYMSLCVQLCDFVLSCRLTALVGPYMKLLGQLRYNQECSPALTFLGLEDITKNMIPNVNDILPLCPQQVTHNVRGALKSTERH